jgi:hypothetical protein
MPKRINFFVATLLVALLAAASSFGYAQANDSGTETKNKSQPTAPNTPAPLSPLSPSPSGPTPGAPDQAPAPVFPRGPTAEQDSVLRRQRPEFKATGFELGTTASKIGLIEPSKEAAKRSGLSSFVVFPKVGFEAAYDSNLFRTKNEISDKILIVSPSVTIRSDWENHALEFLGAAKIARHNKTTTEDYEDVRGRVSGRVDLYDNLSVSALVQYGQGHQRRGEIIDPGDTSTATIIKRGLARVRAKLELAAVTLSAAAESETSDFVSSSTVDNDDLDHDEHTVTLRTSLEIDSGTSVFVQPEYNRRIYRRKIDLSGFEQDSHGFEVLSGIRWDASGVTFVELGLGYLWQNYDEARFATIDGVTASAQAIWNFSDLWTLTFGLSRTVSETADQDLSGVLKTNFKSRLDYEFLYNTLFSLRFEFSDEDYKSSTRADDRTIGGLRIKHLINEYLFAEFDILHERLSSNRDDEDYKVTTGFLRLGAQI